MSDTQAKTIIAKHQSRYYFIENFEEVQTLPVSNYRLDWNLSQGYYLTRLPDREPIKKVYSNDNLFIKHVVNSIHNSTDKNTGILLTGLKGLGKTFTARQLCENIGLPSILIDKQYDQDMFHFLNSITIPHTLYIDEFEKLYPEKAEGNKISQEKFLSYLDGNMSNDIKKVFIITTNNRVNDLFINRPSRLKYVRKYNKLEDVIIKEVIDDLLYDKSLAEDLIINLEKSSLNIDILIKIIEEINTTKTPYSQFKHFFNFEVESKNYELTLVNENNDRTILTTFNWTDDYLQKVLSGKIRVVIYNDISDEIHMSSDIGLKVQSIVNTKYGEYVTKAVIPVYYSGEKYSKLSEEEKEILEEVGYINKIYTLEINRNFVKYVL